MRALDGFADVLAAVPPDRWDTSSACGEWTLRDVVGHVVWSLEQVSHWATGRAYDSTAGAPGAPHPGVMAGTDPAATWRSACAGALESLTPEALGRTVHILAFGTVPLAAVMPVLALDHLVHTWDIGHPVGLDVRLDPELTVHCLAWARENDLAIRKPGLFRPAVTPPADADEQVRLLAFLGRVAWGHARA